MPLPQAMSFHLEMKTSQETCPECGKPDSIPLVWGKPRSEDAEKIARRELACGGCDIWSALDGIVMNHQCTVCGHRWKTAE